MNAHQYSPHKSALMGSYLALEAISCYADSGNRLRQKGQEQGRHPAEAIIYIDTFICIYHCNDVIYT